MPERARRDADGSSAAAVAATVVAVAVLVGSELASEGTGVGDWDLLFLSGCLTVIAGLWLAAGQPKRFSAMIERLANRGALERGKAAVSGDALTPALYAIDERARRWSTAFGLGLGALVGLAFIVVNLTRSDGLPLSVEIGGPLVGAVGGFLVGRALGRMASYALLPRTFASEGVSFRATPGHIDGAAGLKPLGDYYVYQALLVALPAVFLLAWSLIFLIPTWGDRYPGWRPWYLAFLALAICIELAAFAVPLWRVHRVMDEQKHAALREADTVLGPDIGRARKQLERDLDSERRNEVRDWLDQLTTSYEEIENMPTWPLDRTLRRRMTLGNVALVVPLISEIVTLGGFD